MAETPKPINDIKYWKDLYVKNKNQFLDELSSRLEYKLSEEDTAFPDLMDFLLVETCGKKSLDYVLSGIRKKLRGR